MIIDRIGSPTNEILADKTAGRANQGGTTHLAQVAGAHATLSIDTVAIGSLVAQAMQTPAVRQNKIESLKATVANGNYPIDTHEIASAVLKDRIG